VEQWRRAPHTPAGLALPPMVVESWNRCLSDYRLDPGAKPIEVVDEASTVRERRDRLGAFLGIARTEMENLYQQTAGSGYAILLTDASGAIVERVVDPSLENEFTQGGLWLGADWSERHAGTNGMGTCLHERQSVIIHRDEHFLTCNTPLSCSASPIMSPDGELLGVLDASSLGCRDTRESQRHTMALVSMSAQMIENCNFLQTFRDRWVLRFHVRPEFVGLLAEGMLAIDGNGEILAANQSAIQQLGLKSRTDVLGHAVDEILNLPVNSIGQRGERQDYSVWPVCDLRYGKRYFATLRGPEIGTRTEARQPRERKGVIRPLPLATRGKVYSLRALMRGGDPRMAYNVRCAERLVDRNVPILLYGETGTGKEALANAIHAASRRASEPFVAVNCASIPESLIESELFGYRPGAFTGARRGGMRGKIRQSSGGTLFLDEIGDMPRELQTRLLRVLEQQEILPLGSETPIPVNLNVISATHRDLPALVAEGQFREDLYYRLNGASLTLPALRERRDRDTVIRAVLAEECGEGEEVGIEADAFERLMNYPWPGNIRQLRNCIRTTLALCDDGIIRLADLPTEILRNPAAQRTPEPVPRPGPDPERPPVIEDLEPTADPGGNPLASAEKQTLLQELERHHGNITSTAASLGISRNTIYRKMSKHGIEFSHGRYR
jgi:transcriptional regulator of acetoin/glycerol metabolism